jgi:branched-subunit amino acid transport protein
MFVVTYSVRLLPFLSDRLDTLPSWMRRYLTFIPPAALGALIVPDVFAGGALPGYDEVTTIVIVLVALAVAAGTAAKTRSIVVPVAAAVAIVYAGVLLGG